MANEVKEIVDSVLTVVEELKRTNNERLDALEKRGVVDPLIEEKLAKIQDAVDAAEESKRIALDVAKKQGRQILGLHSRDDGLDKDQIEYRKGLDKYLRKGIDSGLSDLQAKAMQVQADPDGGYLVLPTRSSQILRNQIETSPMRQIASTITIGTDSYEQPRLVTRGSTGGWVGETGQRGTTATPKIGVLKIPTHEVFAQPAASQKFLDDAEIDVEGWLSAEISDEFTFIENSAFVTGTGVGQPRGFLTYPDGTTDGKIEQVSSGTSGQVTADGLIKLQAQLKDLYQPGATWLVNRLVKRDIRLLKDSQGRYIWEPGQWGAMPQGIPDMLLGRPISQASDMPVAAANSLSVAFGDFRKGYYIVDRAGIRVLRDPFTSKPNVLFYSTKRVGGDVAIFEAIKLLKLAA